MTVYVDDMYRYPAGQFRRMKMSHMIADTENELHTMARRIGVARKWYQGDHYDIAMSKRALAVSYGAVEITWKELGMMMKQRRRRAMTEKLDAKFYGEIRKVKDDSIVPDDQYIVFLAKDNALPGTLRHYRNLCAQLGCEQEQLDGVDRMITRLEKWRGENIDLLKNPDAKGEKLLDQP